MPSTKTCPNASELLAFIRFPVAGGPQEGIAEHVDACEPCAARLAALDTHARLLADVRELGQAQAEVGNSSEKHPECVVLWEGD